MSTSEIIIKDLGRLTPFGHTFDVYIKNDHGLMPQWAGARVPGTSVAWRIDGDVWRNHNVSDLSYWFNIPELVEYYETVIPNGFLIGSRVSGGNVTKPTHTDGMNGTTLVCPFGAFLMDLKQHRWKTGDRQTVCETIGGLTWIVMNDPWQLSGNPASDSPVTPRMHRFVGNLLKITLFSFGLVTVLRQTQFDALTKKALSLMAILIIGMGR